MAGNPLVRRDLLSQVAQKPCVAQPQVSWGLEIAIYLYLGGLGAGAFIVAVVCGWLGLRLAPTYVSPVGGWVWDWSNALVLWGPFATAFGASLLIFHLGRNRLLFYTAYRNPKTSWMARGFIILAAFIVVGCVVAMVALLFPFWSLRLAAAWHLLEGVGVLLALGTAIYTGVLLWSIKFIPAWNALHLPLLFLASALSTGTMGVIAGASIYSFVAAEPASAYRLIHGLETVEPGLIVVEATVLSLYVRHLWKGQLEARLSAQMWLTGSWRYGFWIGIVGAALAFPFVLDVVNVGVGSDVLGVIAAASVLVGGFLLRLGILRIALKAPPPLYKLGEWQARRVRSRPTPVQDETRERASLLVSE